MFTRHVTRIQPEWAGRVGGEEFKGSTDMGNVSQVVPSIHPMYYIGEAGNHTREFTEMAASTQAQEYTLNQGKALAMTCVELMMDRELLSRSQTEFQQHKMVEGKCG